VQDPKQQQWLLEPGGIAARLRSLQGKTPGVAFAEASGLRPSKVSKLRLGQQLPTEDDIKAWVAASGGKGADEKELLALLAEADQHHSSFERKLKRGQTKHQGDYNELVDQAEVIRMLERSFVPRLLQTLDYAKAIMRGSMVLHKTADDVDASARKRLECQSALTDGRHRFEFVIDETVLTRDVASPAVMHEQVDRILHATELLSNVRIGILPVYGTFHDPVRNSFELYGDVGIVETYYKDEALDTEQWVKHDEAMAAIWQDAVEGDEARTLIRKAMDHHAKAMKQRKPKGAK
jgi:hypothetical protein